MQTERLSPAQIERAAYFLRSGFVVAFPTETVYGLGASVFNEASVAEIFRLKARPADNPLIVHISSISDIQKVAIDIPDSFYCLAELFFPGPCTVILKRHPNVPSIVSAGLETVAVRMPSNPIAKRLIEAVGEPLAAPSANISGRPSPTTCDHVLEDFDGKIAMVIDGGKTEFGIESTVISLLQTPLQLLRPGSITKTQLEEVIGCPIVEVETHSISGKVASPGMKYRHYCPRTPIRLFSSQKELVSAAEKERHPMVLTCYAEFPLVHGSHFFLCAKELYALLRYADAKHYSCILVLCDEPLLGDPALKNRLFRAGKNL